MLNDIFGSKNDDGDWFLDDYKNVMINKIKDTFDKFGKEYIYIRIYRRNIICLFF